MLYDHNRGQGHVRSPGKKGQAKKFRDLELRCDSMTKSQRTKSQKTKSQKTISQKTKSQMDKSQEDKSQIS